MLKFVALGAVAAASLLTAAAPAAAAERVTEVRISVAGKTFSQLNGEIRAAAAAVCGDADEVCVTAAVNSGLRQLRALHLDRPAQVAAELPRIQILQGGVYAARVSLKGKTQAQIQADIVAAAQAVCRPTAMGLGELSACVDGAVRSANERLHAQDAVRELASN